MKKESGITLLTLMVYIIGLMIVIGIIGGITNFFMTNVMGKEQFAMNVAEFSKFNLAFIDEVKTYQNKVTEIDTNHVTFSSGNKYTFQDSNIYQNKVAIATGITKCEFKLKTIEYKQIVSVYIEIGNDNPFSKTIDYVLYYDSDQIVN